MDQRVKKLLELNEEINPRDLFPTIEEGASKLIEENPFAFAVAASLDRQTKAEIIWTIPYYIKQEIGEIKPNTFYNKPREEISELLDELPKKPRYINDAPRTIKELSNIVVEEYSGDTESIWKNKSSKQVKEKFKEIYGVGEGISSMILILLDRAFDVDFTDLDQKNMNVKADTHVVRVFQRLGFIEEASRKETKEAAAKLYPKYPGKLDSATWIIGRKWCDKTNPLCRNCPMTELCPKEDAKPLDECKN